MQMGRALGEAVFRLDMLTAPAAIVVSLIFPVQGPASAVHFGFFLIALAGSILLTGALNFIVGTFAIRMKSILGLLRAKYFVFELLSGLLVPMTMFPETAQKVVAYLPFQHIAYTPLRLYLGKLNGPEIYQALAVQYLWVVVLALFGAWFWSVMVRKVTIHGG